MEPSSSDFAQLKSNMKASWMAGDFGQIKEKTQQKTRPSHRSQTRSFSEANSVSETITPELFEDTQGCA